MRRYAAWTFLLLLAAPVALAEEAKAPGKQPRARLESGPGVLANSIDRRVAFLIVHREALALVSDQMTRLNEILLESSRNRQRQDDVLQALSEGLEAKLGRDEPDAEAAKTLVDESFRKLADAAKFNVDAYVRVQAVLTPEQRVLADKLRESLRQERIKKTQEITDRMAESAKKS